MGREFRRARFALSGGPVEFRRYAAREIGGVVGGPEPVAKGAEISGMPPTSVVSKGTFAATLSSTM